MVFLKAQNQNYKLKFLRYNLKIAQSSKRILGDFFCMEVMQNKAQNLKQFCIFASK